MKFQNIPQMTKANYAVDVPWWHLLDHLKRYEEEYTLDCDPDFQRAHVWDEVQQTAYVEYILRGGISGRDVFFNCPHFMSLRDNQGPIVLVDGKQRIHAVSLFLTNQLKAFGYYHNQFQDKVPFQATFRMHVNNLTLRSEVLQWYLDLNSGVAHTNEELDKVREMLDYERKHYV